MEEQIKFKEGLDALLDLAAAPGKASAHSVRFPVYPRG